MFWPNSESPCDNCIESNEKHEQPSDDNRARQGCLVLLVGGPRLEVRLLQRIPDLGVRVLLRETNTGKPHNSE